MRVGTAHGHGACSVGDASTKETVSRSGISCSLLVWADWQDGASRWIAAMLRVT